ncbi:MAG: methyltransferase domain-containing protein [Chloroflexia bacterium]
MEVPSHRDHLLSAVQEWGEKFAALSAQLNATRTLREPTFSSRLPLLGPLIVALRTLWGYIAAKWYARSIIEQQNRFNVEVVRAVDTLASVAVDLGHSLARMDQERTATQPTRGYEFIGTWSEEILTQLDEAALRQWEEADLPAPGAYSCQHEIEAGEKQDLELGLNYPLHWRSWDESWRYLFDLALIAEALACRPGDLVLDYAAGPCWVAEFLNRLSIRTVSLDISPAMLQRGQQRMRADQRLVRDATPFFVVGDALHLPFADGSFDGVICMNALHHMPSYRQALSEIHRVLKPGGRAVFSEPGSQHARHPLAQWRMKETGVLEKNVPLPLIYVLARQVGFHKMQVIPLAHPSYYVVDYTATPADNEALEQLWITTSQISLSHYSRFVLEKSPPRIPDTYAPPARIFARRLSAEITPRRTCAQTLVNGVFTDQLVVRNTGDLLWRAHPTPFGGEVYLAVQAYAEAGNLVQDNLARAPLPHDVAPGEAVEIDIPVVASLPPGRYWLQYDMVVEHITWFEHRGSPVLRRPLEVLALPGEITLVETCAQVPVNGILRDRLRLRNASPFLWPARGPLFGGPLHVGVKVYTLDGQFVRDDLGRTPLPCDVAPGEAVEMEVAIPAELPPGTYILRYALVIEQVAWLEHAGSPTIERTLEVTPGVGDR